MLIFVGILLERIGFFQKGHRFLNKKIPMTLTKSHGKFITLKNPILKKPCKFKEKSARQDSNLRLQRPERCALPS